MKQANIILIAGVSQGFSTVMNLHLTSLSCSIFLKTCQYFSCWERWESEQTGTFFFSPNPLPSHVLPPAATAQRPSDFFLG